MQKKLSKGPLLNDQGHLHEAGYAFQLVKDYQRSKIKASKLRIKEWDYYFLQGHGFGVALTIADNAYMGLISVSYFDFSKPSFHTRSKIILLSMGRMRLPSSSKEGNIIIKRKGIDFQFLNDGKKRYLKAYFAKFKDKAPFIIEAVLDQEPKDSMVIATPFKEKATAFYYNQKILGMRVEGSISIGNIQKTFSDDAFGLLDWGRGVWTYKNTWYWGAGHGIIDGKVFAFNIGYGFGDTSNATENMLFYNGKGHKLDDVHFNIPKDDQGKYLFTEPWTFTSSDQRFTMNFRPLIDRKDYLSLGILKSDQHQVFGYFSGEAILDDGKVINLEEFLGFAEVISNKW